MCKALCAVEEHRDLKSIKWNIKPLSSLWSVFFYNKGEHLVIFHRLSTISCKSITSTRLKLFTQYSTGVADQFIRGLSSGDLFFCFYDPRSTRLDVRVPRSESCSPCAWIEPAWPPGEEVRPWREKVESTDWFRLPDKSNTGLPEQWSGLWGGDNSSSELDIRFLLRLIGDNWFCLLPEEFVFSLFSLLEQETQQKLKMSDGAKEDVQPRKFATLNARLSWMFSPCGCIENIIWTLVICIGLVVNKWVYLLISLSEPRFISLDALD